MPSLNFEDALLARRLLNGRRFFDVCEELHQSLINTFMLVFSLCATNASENVYMYAKDSVGLPY